MASTKKPTKKSAKSSAAKGAGKSSLTGSAQELSLKIVQTGPTVEQPRSRVAPA